MKTHTQKSPNRSKKTLLVLVAAVAMVGSIAFAGQAQSEDSEADIIVTFHSDDMGITVNSSKGLSNVIIEDCLGETHKHEGLGEELKDWTHRESFVIAGVWIKSGSVKDEDGPPGAGERFLNEDGQCEEQPPCVGPADVMVTALDEGILVNWTAVVDADSYNVYRKSGDGSFSLLTTTDETTTHVDTDVSAGNAYTYRVTAMVDGNETGHCDEATATAIPVFPTLVAAGLAAAIGVGAYAFAGRRR